MLIQISQQELQIIFVKWQLFDKYGFLFELYNYYSVSLATMLFCLHHKGVHYGLLMVRMRVAVDLN